MAAYAALVSLMNTIDHIMKHPRLSISFNKKQIQLLVEKAGFLLEFIEENNYGGGTGSCSKEAEDVERQIASAAHAAEDVIESHIVDQIHKGSTLGISFLITLLVLKCMGCTLELQHVIEDMDAVVKEVTELKEKHGDSRDAAAALMGTGEEQAQRMVGLDDELMQLLDELTGDQSSRRVTSIVGMGGMGKTTLAKNVYENPLIIEHFQFHAWATVSEQHDAHKILSQLLSGLGISTSTRSVDSLGKELHEILSDKRYLIVLDDIRSVGAWDQVRGFFPDNGNKSRVVLTTRMLDVAKDCESSVFRMNLLDEEKSWELFCEKISIQHGDWPTPNLEEIGKKIVELCKGLALSIVVIGGLLRKAPRTVGHWENVVRDIEKQDTLDVLSLSYYHLPPHLKPCFLYMGAFKENSEIRISKITKLWVAEGFVKEEEIAEGYLNDLIDRNLVVVGRLRKNGKIGSCRIHDLLRDLCIKLGDQQQFFHHVRSYGDDEIGSTDRRLVFHIYLRETELPHARSIMLREYHNEAIVGRLVRVLDAEECATESKKCETELYRNVNLRYIAYQQPHDDENPWWMLPSSVSVLWNLQTLIIKESSISPTVVAPCEFWKMQQLRHVKCHKIYLVDPRRCNNRLILDNLQTLKVAVNLRVSKEVCKMIPNIKKLHLLYDSYLPGYYDHFLVDESLFNLRHFRLLKSLKLKINSSWPIPEDPEMIRELIRFPSSLNKLSLTNCRLHWNDLRRIGSFPLLQVLELEYDSVTEGERWSPIEGQFQSLKFLKINHCGLSFWDHANFPVLEKLILERLHALKEIPKDMGEISTLKLIRVEFCSISAAISAVKIKQQRHTWENDHLQIQVKINASDLESFEEQLVTEELTLVKFQLEIEED